MPIVDLIPAINYQCHIKTGRTVVFSLLDSDGVAHENNLIAMGHPLTLAHTSYATHKSTEVLMVCEVFKLSRSLHALSCHVFCMR